MNPWQELEEMARRAKAFLPRGSRQKELDQSLRDWRIKGYDKAHDRKPIVRRKHG